MTAKRRRACARVPRRCRPCCRRSPKADAYKPIEWETKYAPPATFDRRRRPHRAFGRAGRLWQHGRFRSVRSARLPRHQEEAARRPQAGVPRRRAGPRAGRAEGPLQGLPSAGRRPERTGCGCLPPAEEPKSKRGAKAKGKQAAAPAAADPDAAPEEEGSTAAAPPAPKPAKIVRKRTTAPPPDQSAAPAQSPQQSAFPAPMPSGTFTR